MNYTKSVYRNETIEMHNAEILVVKIKCTCKTRIKTNLDAWFKCTNVSYYQTMLTYITLQSQINIKVKLVVSLNKPVVCALMKTVLPQYVNLNEEYGTLLFSPPKLYPIVRFLITALELPVCEQLSYYITSISFTPAHALVSISS